MLNKKHTHAAFQKGNAPRDDFLYDSCFDGRAYGRAKKVAILAFLALGVGIVIAVVANQTSLAIAYHEWQMDRAYRRAYSDPVVHPDGLVSHVVDEDFVDYEHHRDRLVDFGAIHRIDYRFARLRTGTPEARAMTRLMLSGQCPALVDFISTVLKEPQLMQLTLWCRPDDTPAWQAFFRSHDIESE